MTAHHPPSSQETWLHKIKADRPFVRTSKQMPATTCQKKYANAGISVPKFSATIQHTAVLPMSVGTAPVTDTKVVPAPLVKHPDKAKDSDLAPASQGKVPTPVKWIELEQYLEGYTQQVVNFLVDGFRNGFRINVGNTMGPLNAKNLKSAYEHGEVLRQKIDKEVREGKVAGPFEKPPLDNFIISPVGLVPKKKPGEFRRIHHLSHPQGHSVNDNIAKKDTAVSYQTVDDAIQEVLATGQSAYMAKTDIEGAYRIMPIHPDSYHLLGMKIGSDYFYDRVLPMGLASSCKLFEEFSTALHWVANNKLNICHMVHILDDFFIVAPTEKECSGQLNEFLTFCKIVGIPLAKDKTLGPDTTMSFAGIELDSVAQEARLPEDKLKKCQELLTLYQHKKKITLKELESLTGYLNFCCYVIPGGRAFLRRLYDLTASVKSKHHKIRLTKEHRADISTWKMFVDNFNGKGFMHNQTWDNEETVSIYTDASGSIGFGGIFGSKYFYGSWPETCSHLNITVLELYPIAIALEIWVTILQGKKVWLHTDNEALVHVINNSTSKEPPVMKMVRKIVLICMQNNIMVRCTHIEGSKNVLADSLSRLKLQTFYSLTRNMELQPTSIPPELQPTNYLTN